MRSSEAEGLGWRSVGSRVLSWQIESAEAIHEFRSLKNLTYFIELQENIQPFLNYLAIGLQPSVEV